MMNAARVVKVVVVLAILFFGTRFLLRGTARDRRIRLLGAQADLLDLRLDVLRFWDVRGSLPDVLEDTMTIRGSSPPTGVFEFHRPRGRQAVDSWHEPLRYEKDADGAGFAIRSAGPDGGWGTPDDLATVGRAGEDKKPVYAEFKAKFDEYTALLDEKSRLHRRNRWTGLDR
jgi:hypothetical protein